MVDGPRRGGAGVGLRPAAQLAAAFEPEELDDVVLDDEPDDDELDEPDEEGFEEEVVELFDERESVR